MKYIHDHISERLVLADVAAKFGYSKWYFSEKFRRYTGHTFTEYVRRYRMQLAAIELLSGKKTIEVSMDYGYESVSGFNKSFLTEFGCLPREYKKHAKSSELYRERRRFSMYPLSDRCASLREEAVNQKTYIHSYWARREVYYTLGVIENIGKNLENEELVSAGICKVIDCFQPLIKPGEIIVGVNFGDGKLGEWTRINDTPEDRKALQANSISEDEIETYFSKRNMLDTAFRKSVMEEWSKAEKDSETEWAAIGRGVDGNHTVLGYEKVLELGFEGLLHEVEALEAKNGTNSLYRAAKQVCRHACKMGEAYAQKAEELLTANDPAYDAEDLKTIMRICSNVPRKPAGTFDEAVQALWFAHIINTWEDYINANSVGRLDQILYPYYKHDIDCGLLTKEQAFEIVCCLWIKLYRDYDVQQSCVGGTAPDGTSQVNELSYMMLDATEQLNFVRCLSVRFGSGTDRAFLKRALEVVGHVQKGVPFFFNDDVMIPALISKGIEPEDAFDYTQIGCVETVIPGKANPHAVTGEINCLKALEYVFCNGNSMMYPNYNPGVKTGSLDQFATYQALYNAVITQIERLLDLSCSKVKKMRDASCVNSPKPYKSLLTEGCMETGRDFNDSGSKYDYYQIMLSGIPNLADSLAVIRKFVYEDRRYTLQQMKDILEADFPDESVRYDFINKAPKFGNDLEEVDNIAVDITDRCCRILDDLSNTYGISFHAQPFTFLWMIEMGERSAASPDGRHKGEILAYSVSPMQGRDFNGLTALLNSIAKFPTKKTPGTTSAIVEVDPKLFTDRNIGQLADILAASGAKGLSNVQFNTIDADTLIDAQQHPEKYNNLAVRVSGFSQKFNLLSPQLQNHIIGRTKHTCL